MALTCNIDKTGRILRIVIGIVFGLNGAMLYKYDLPGADVGSRALQLLFVLSGLFCIFEGVAGWCAFRAMGVKTKF